MSRTGKIKWINEVNGYGFIEPADATGDVMIHATAVAPNVWRKLGTGVAVVFESETTPRGERLTSLLKIEDVRESERCANALLLAANAEPDPRIAATFRRASEICQAIARG